MLDPSRKASDIAMRLRGELGDDAFSFVSTRVEEARQACDQRELRRWNDVASELLALDRREGGDRPSAFWGLMQRIEYYRHRATEVERKAAATPEPYRHDLLELAGQWRELALHADLQARLSAKRASPEDA